MGGEANHPRHAMMDQIQKAVVAEMAAHPACKDLDPLTAKVILGEALVRLGIEMALDAIIPFNREALGEVSVRAVGLLLSAAPDDFRGLMLEQIMLNSLECCTDRLEAGTGIHSTWGEYREQ